MTDISNLDDRALCLRLAGALGWLDSNFIDPMLKTGTVEQRACTTDALLTPAGAFAVLGSMRERGWTYLVEFDQLATPRQHDVQFAHPGRKRFHSRDHPDLARAIAEAACAALEAGS